MILINLIQLSSSSRLTSPQLNEEQTICLQNGFFYFSSVRNQKRRKTKSGNGNKFAGGIIKE